MNNIILDVNKWKKFKVGKIFECKTTPNSVKADLSDGETPYISRTALNNGRDGGVEIDEDRITKGNCITIGAEGFYAFYQNKDFATGVKIYTLRNKHMDPEVGLFIATLLNLEVYKYNYSRARILEKIKNETIKLPVDEKGKPDWEWMRKCVRFFSKIEKNRIKQLLEIE